MAEVDVAPDAIYAVTVDGVITWGSSYTLTCPECGADRGWSLRVQRPHGVNGELAWAECPAEHHVNHPLVYPRMVHTVFTWARGTAPRPPIAELLRGIRWEPHALEWIDSEHSDTLPATAWWPWSTWPAVTFAWNAFWGGQWPELVRAHKAAAS